jgi:hypothetical protein
MLMMDPAEVGRMSSPRRSLVEWAVLLSNPLRLKRRFLRRRNRRAADRWYLVFKRMSDNAERHMMRVRWLRVMGREP